MAKIKNYMVSVKLKSGVTFAFRDADDIRNGSSALISYQNHKDIIDYPTGGGSYDYVIIPYHAICALVSTVTATDYVAPKDEMCAE